MILVGLVAAACSGPTPMDSTTTTATTVPTSTTTTTTTTTAVPEASPEVPAYFRFGDDGLSAVEPGGAETRLVDLPVEWAASDHLGGVVFRHPWYVDRVFLGTQWIPAGSTEPVELSPNSGFTGVIGDRPVFAWTIDGPADDAGRNVGIGFIDLVSGEEWTIEGDFGTGGVDRSDDPCCLGGDLAVGVTRQYGGSCSTDLFIRFWSLEARGPVGLEHNPQPGSCEPCTLSVRLSPDGTKLAWWKTTAAKWPCPELDCLDDDGFWKSMVNIPADLSVVDLSDGRVLWATELDNRERLEDFDGRWLVVGDRERSLVYDTRGGTEPIVEIPGRVILDQRGDPFDVVNRSD